MGTVPALAANGDRISTNHEIARFLDAHHPEPALFPADPDRRAAVKEAERWANEKLQMAARRIPGAAAVRDPETFSRGAGDGRLGYLLYKRERVRRLVVLPDVRLELDDPPHAPAGCVVADEAGPEQGASRLQGGMREGRALEDGQLGSG
jgi:hypothetical protein